MAKVFDERIAKPIVARLPSWIRANHLSFVRAALVVPIIIWRDRPLLALGLLIASSLLDIFDGPVARLRNESSQFGAILDATGDKVLILGALFFACGDRVSLTTRLAVAGLDLVLTAMRPIKHWLGASASSNFWGAAKMWVQSIALGMVLSRFAWAVEPAPYIFYAAIACAVLSLTTHLRDCFGCGHTTSS